MSVNYIEKKKEIDFLESSLWGAITFCKMLSGDKKLTLLDIVKLYKKYLGIGDEYVSDDTLIVLYYRVQTKVDSVYNKNTNLFPSEIEAQINDLKSMIRDLECKSQKKHGKRSTNTSL